MTTHFKDHDTAEGVRAVCGNVSAGKSRVPVTFDLSEVTCQRCLISDAFIKAKARLGSALDDPRLPSRILGSARTPTAGDGK